MKKNHWVWAGGVGVVILLLVMWGAPFLFPESYTESNVTLQNLSASMEHFLGTDKFGRDIFVRVCQGARISVIVGGTTAGICSIAGLLLGSIAGYYGGWVDEMVVRGLDLLDSIPSMIYVILLSLVLEGGYISMITGICIAGWTGVARVVRGEMLRVKSKEYYLAARLAGAGYWYVLRTCLWQNAKSICLIQMVLLIPKAMITESFLSFLGLGIMAPQASLGVLMQESRTRLQLYPVEMLAPMGMLFLLIFFVNMIGYGMEKEEY